MASARQHIDEGDLNSVFKRLGERGREGELIKKHNEFDAGPNLQFLTKFLMRVNENQVIVTPYGSAAEDLKCVSPDDHGDTDLMVFPSSEALLIHEEMVDLLESPLHARIRARDHPVLRSCLVEGTEYLATSALKNFDPAIYGSQFSKFMDYFKFSLRVLAKDDPKDPLQVVVNLKNKEESPALTIETTESGDTFLEQLQKMTELKRLTSLNSARWEWLASAMCTMRGVEYTREHAAVLDDFLQYAGELQESLTEHGPDGILEGYPAFFREIISSDAGKNFIARVKAIESRSRNENVTRAEVLCPDDSSVTPLKSNAVKGGSKLRTTDHGPEVMPSSSNDTTPTHTMKYTGCPNTLQPEKPTNRDANNPTRNTVDHPCGREAEVKKPSKDDKASGDGTVSDRTKQKEESGEREKFDLKRWMNHLTWTEIENEGHDNEEEDSITLEHGIDLVPAMRSRGWPKSSQDWLERERKWPSDEMVTRIIDEGYHLVVKSPKYKKKPEFDFRISFSHAAYLLSQEMNDIQRDCYCCLKRVYRAHLSSPEGLVSFHLKNLFLQTIEETGAEMWTESKRAQCVMKLLGNLRKALKEQDLRHFFVRSYNLFGADYIKEPENLAALAEMVEKIIENPMDLIKQIGEDAKQVKKNELHQDGKPAVPGRDAEPECLNDNQENKHVLTDAVLHSPQQNGNLLPNYRYHDMQDMYLQVGKELVEKALNGDEIHDPLERSLVEDLKEMMHSRNFQTEHFLKMLRNGWSNAYIRICISTELEMRRAMLGAIRGDVETWKYVLRQEDLAPGNAAAIGYRLLDPSNEDGFDVGNIMPAGGVVQF